MSSNYERVGLRVRAIAGYCRKLESGPRSRLAGLKQGEISTNIYDIITRFVESFKDEKDPARDWLDPGTSMLPSSEDPGHYKGVQAWAHISSLIARATATNGRCYADSTRTLGQACAKIDMNPRVFENLFADRTAWPHLHPSKLEDLVTRFKNAQVSFDVTPLAYGILFPNAEDIQERRYQIGRSFYLNRPRSNSTSSRK